MGVIFIIFPAVFFMAACAIVMLLRIVSKQKKQILAKEYRLEEKMNGKELTQANEYYRYFDFDILQTPF